MKTITFHNGDKMVIDGNIIDIPQTITLSSNARRFEKIPAPGITDLPETDLRIPDVFRNRGHRIHTDLRQDLRCPCGSVYTRQSMTHISCQFCKRVWRNEDDPATDVDPFYGWIDSEELTEKS